MNKIELLRTLSFLLQLTQTTFFCTSIYCNYFRIPPPHPPLTSHKKCACWLVFPSYGPIGSCSIFVFYKCCNAEDKSSRLASSSRGFLFVWRWDSSSRWASSSHCKIASKARHHIASKSRHHTYIYIYYIVGSPLGSAVDELKLL